MGGKVLDYDAKDIRNEGIKKGERNQRKFAVIKMLDLGRTPEAISEFTGEDLAYIKGVEKERLQVSEAYGKYDDED